MYKRSSSFHNSPSFTHRKNSYGSVVQRSAERVNADLQRRREKARMRMEGADRTPEAIAQSRRQLGMLLANLCGDRPVSDFVDVMPAGDFNALLQLLWGAKLYPSGHPLMIIRERAAKLRTASLPRMDREHVTREILPTVAELIQNHGNSAAEY